MKHVLLLLAVLLAAPFAAPVHATEVAAQSTFPANFVPVEMRRWVRDDSYAWDHISAHANSYGPPWHNEARLGWLSTQPFANSHALYSCQRLKSGDHFTSMQEQCEGERRVASPYVLGYVSSAHIAGTYPLYRCLAHGSKNEFDSTHAQCEGHIMIGTLGFIFP